MLAESILTGIAYKDELYPSHKCQVIKTVAEESWKDELTDTEANKSFPTKPEKQTAVITAACCGNEMIQEIHSWNSAQKSPRKGCNDIATSAPLRIPRREQYCEKELDLYRSWSSQSLYQHYPDLYIGGDHVADHTCDSGCVLDHTCNTPPGGPVLLSEDIPLGQSCLSESLQKPKTIKLWNGDDAGDRSMILPRQPLSNSMINHYMETKVQELYKQFLEEKLTQCNSITHFLTSNLLMNNISEASVQLSHEQHTGCAKHTLLPALPQFGLQNASHGNSSEFSTPNLQISKLLCKRKSSGVQSTS
ncbi:TLR adapter interacting with SLC15A4 on the lysosome-like [Hemicordylus capensis]|uniref:TLR adapter interacting with SLC15A4 on the lysosome-like n=1 Tax=Hemicordylus capensis TaxID=884348 RepID=UPI002302D318|nr:TLR adapter interacting with SLC15A4 on the lysosome-like [Hemicordylus capensis]